MSLPCMDASVPSEAFCEAIKRFNSAIILSSFSGTVRRRIKAPLWSSEMSSRIPKNLICLDKG
eukprot:8427025-Karenia_brevis.AAC.1